MSLAIRLDTIPGVIDSQVCYRPFSAFGLRESGPTAPSETRTVGKGVSSLREAGERKKEAPEKAERGYSQSQFV